MNSEIKNKTVVNIVSRMTLEQKIGAVLTLGFSGTVVRPHILDAIEKYHCGGLRLTPGSRTFGNYVEPKSGRTILNVEDSKGYKKGVNAPAVTVAEYKEILDGLQALAMKRPLGIPLHFSFDQEGGSNADFFFGGVNIFPKPMGLRATGDPRMCREVGLAIARQGRATGFNWIHSPDLDINVNPNNPGICTRSYSDRMEDVIEYAEQTCLGFKEGRLICTGKHFPGRGESSVDPHYAELTITIDRDTLYSRELMPYKHLIEKNLLPAIMVAHCIYPKIDENNVSTVSKKIITGIARDHLGFEGVITTDSMTMGAISTRYKVEEACAMALQAGADLVLMKAENGLVEATFMAIKRYIEEGKISESELDEKVYRILNCKFEYGLFHYGTLWPEAPENAIRDPKIMNLSRLVGRKSVIVTRNIKDALPLPKDGKVLVIEQRQTDFNDIHWHPGILFKHCLKYNPGATYLEIDFTPDESDINSIRGLAKEFDTIVITSFYYRSSKGNLDIVTELARDHSKNVIVIANTPYPNSIPPHAQTVLVSLATSPQNMEATAGVLFGEISPEGEWPVAYRDQYQEKLPSTAN
jgi:beta-N-acetylhexosaminidase